MIMKCTSRNSRKTRMKVNFGHSFKTTTIPGKVRHPSFTKNVFKFTLSKLSVAKLKATSGPKFSSCTYKCTSLKSNANKKVIEYKIENEVIAKDILSFRDVANVFIKMFNSKNNGKRIDVKNDSPYLILKYHEKNIKTISMFRSMKLDDVINDKVFFALSYL